MAQALPLLKALVEPVRIRLYLLLKNSSLTVSELSEILELSQSNTSHHVKALRDLGLLTAEKIGQHTYYGLNPETTGEPRVATLLKNLSDLGDELSETRSDATRLKGVLANRSEETFQLWRMEQPDLPYSDIFAHVSAGRRGRVVDVGCGEGDFFEALTLSFEDVIGLDINAAHMPRAAMRAKALRNVRVIMADAQSLPLETNTVDTVVFRMALSQIPRADAAIAEAGRVLRKSGFISIIDGEKKSAENFRNTVLSHLGTMKAFEIDFERSLPRLFMLRARKI